MTGRRAFLAAAAALPLAPESARARPQPAATPPADAYVNAVKRRAFRCGLAVSGTGVRNDFTVPDAAKRQADVGSPRTADPCEEIARLAPFASTWQVKQSVYRNGVEEKTDLRRLAGIVKAAGYRGYLPLETLGPGEPVTKLRRWLDEVRQAFA